MRGGFSPSVRWASVGAMCAILLVMGVASRAEMLPDGDPFQINTIEQQNQVGPAVAAQSSGGFVVAWEGSEEVGQPFRGILAQRLDTRGNKVGTEFQANVSLRNASIGQFKAEVATHSDGGFVVAWDTDGQDGSFQGLSAQRFSEDATKLGTEFQINSYTTFSQYGSAISTLGSGEFVVAWMDTGYFGARGSNIFAQRFDQSAIRIGSEFQVPQSLAGSPVLPAVAGLAGGAFVATWISFEQDGSDDGIVSQRFDSSNQKVGEEILVNQYTTGSQRRPRVDGNPDGSFVIVWHSSNQDGGAEGVFGQRFDGSGERVGSEFQINEYTSGTQERPRVVRAPNGSFVVVWTSVGQDGSGRGVFGRRFYSEGKADGAEFQVNTYTIGNQGGRFGNGLDVSIDKGGRIVVVWESEEEDSDQEAIVGQMFCVDPPEGAQVCGNATCVGGADVTSADALATLRAAVGLSVCERCRCDVNGSGHATAADALAILRVALQPGDGSLSCPPCT